MDVREINLANNASTWKFPPPAIQDQKDPPPPSAVETESVDSWDSWETSNAKKQSPLIPQTLQGPPTSSSALIPATLQKPTSNDISKDVADDNDKAQESHDDLSVKTKDGDNETILTGETKIDESAQTNNSTVQTKTDEDASVVSKQKDSKHNNTSPDNDPSSLSTDTKIMDEVTRDMILTLNNDECVAETQEATPKIASCAKDLKKLILKDEYRDDDEESSCFSAEDHDLWLDCKIYPDEATRKGKIKLLFERFHSEFPLVFDTRSEWLESPNKNAVMEVLAGDETVESIVIRYSAIHSSSKESSSPVKDAQPKDKKIDDTTAPKDPPLKDNPPAKVPDATPTMPDATLTMPDATPAESKSDASAKPKEAKGAEKEEEKSTPPPDTYEKLSWRELSGSRSDEEKPLQEVFAEYSAVAKRDMANYITAATEVGEINAETVLLPQDRKPFTHVDFFYFFTPSGTDTTITIKNIANVEIEVPSDNYADQFGGIDESVPFFQEGFIPKLEFQSDNNVDVVLDKHIITETLNPADFRNQLKASGFPENTPREMFDRNFMKHIMRKLKSNVNLFKNLPYIYLQVKTSGTILHTIMVLLELILKYCDKTQTDMIDVSKVFTLEVQRSDLLTAALITAKLLERREMRHIWVKLCSAAEKHNLPLLFAVLSGIQLGKWNQTLNRICELLLHKTNQDLYSFLDLSLYMYNNDFYAQMNKLMLPTKPQLETASATETTTTSTTDKLRRLFGGSAYEPSHLAQALKTEVLTEPPAEQLQKEQEEEQELRWSTLFSAFFKS